MLYAAALLFKAPAVTLPAVLLILDAYPLRRLGVGPRGWFGASARRVWLEKVPFVLLSLIFAGLAVAAREGNLVMIHAAGDTIAKRVARGD